MGFAKWIGGALGWAIGGPIGGLFGFVFGAMVDPALNALKYKNNNSDKYNYYQKQSSPQTTVGDFQLSLLALMAAMMKADGKNLKSELDIIKNVLSQIFQKQDIPSVLATFKKLLQKEIPVNEICLQIRQQMDHSARLELVHILFEIAYADKNFSNSETTLLKRISTNLGISQNDYKSIEAMYIGNKDAAYKILEIDSSATDDEVRKAYRRMAVKYHPDKVAHLGEDVVKKAHEKFTAVNQAWETIKKERNIV